MLQSGGKDEERTLLKTRNLHFYKRKYNFTTWVGMQKFMVASVKYTEALTDKCRASVTRTVLS
jgi:hypothetical protein